MIAEVNVQSEANVILIQDPSQVEIASFGLQGPRGNSILSGNGIPIPSVGINQDLYLDMDSSFVYKKLSGVWEYQTYLRAQQHTFTISPSQFSAKQVTLYPEPSNSDLVALEFLSGGGQENGVDFNVVGSVLSWDGLGLDGFIELGDIIIVRY